MDAVRSMMGRVQGVRASFKNTVSSPKTVVKLEWLAAPHASHPPERQVPQEFLRDYVIMEGRAPPPPPTGPPGAGNNSEVRILVPSTLLQPRTPTSACPLQNAPLPLIYLGQGPKLEPPKPP